MQILPRAFEEWSAAGEGRVKPYCRLAPCRRGIRRCDDPSDGIPAVSHLMPTRRLERRTGIVVLRACWSMRKSLRAEPMDNREHHHPAWPARRAPPACSDGATHSGSVPPRRGCRHAHDGEVKSSATSRIGYMLCMHCSVSRVGFNAHASFDAAIGGKVAGEPLPNLGAPQQRNADENAKPKIAAGVHRQPCAVGVAVARVSDFAMPDAGGVDLVGRNDGQAALRATVQIGRHRLARRAVEAHDATAETVSAPHDLHHATAFSRQPVPLHVRRWRGRRGRRRQPEGKQCCAAGQPMER